METQNFVSQKIRTLHKSNKEFVMQNASLLKSLSIYCTVYALIT